MTIDRVLDGFDNALARERPALRRSTQRGKRRRLEDVQDRLVAGDECGPHVADAWLLVCDRTRTLARKLYGGGSVGQVQLDEEIRHALTVAASAPRRNVETP
jgi:hypothetical protein